MSGWLTPGARIFVAGHRGMVGSAVCRALIEAGHDQLILRNRDELDLRDQSAVDALISKQAPDVVVLAAATVGGIHANNSRPAEFITDNLLIATHLIDAAQRLGVQRLLNLGSSCIYPRNAVQPMCEDQLLKGPLEATNEPYAIAKIAAIKLCESSNRQYSTDYRSLMPTNLYGPGDRFDLEQGHVIPALMLRFHQATKASAEEVTVWGSGRAKREFLMVDDLARACLRVMSTEKADWDELVDPRLSHVNVGTGVDVSIAELAAIMAHVTGFRGRINYDSSRPDGPPRKLLDTSKIKKLAWKPATKLEDGLKITYEWFRSMDDRSNE